MLINQDNKVFIGKRVEPSSEAWQMPQGGIDKAEKPIVAAFRELKEEIGTDKAQVIYESKDWYYYDIPTILVAKWWEGKFIGQKQKWFLMRFLGEDIDINLHTQSPEFISWKWENFEDLSSLTVHFKQQLYKDVIQEFKRYIFS